MWLLAGCGVIEICLGWISRIPQKYSLAVSLLGPSFQHLYLYFRIFLPSVCVSTRRSAMSCFYSLWLVIFSEQLRRNIWLYHRGIVWWFSGDPLSIRGSVPCLYKQFTQPVQLHSLCWARDSPHSSSADCIGLNFSPRSAYFITTVIFLDVAQDHNIKTLRGKNMLSVWQQNEHWFKGRMLFGMVI